MELLVNELSDKKFEIIIYGDQETIHKVFISNQTYQDLTPAKCLRECISMGSDNRFAGNTLLRLYEQLHHTYYRKQFGRN